MECIFCEIIRGRKPCVKVYEDEHVLAFEDIHPVAPVHVLVVPKTHVASLNELDQTGMELLAHIHWGARQVARTKGIEGSGYRTLINTGPDARQEVFHLHLHVLGGRPLNPISA